MGRQASAPLPGGTALSRVRIYDWDTADDEHGGSAHVHLACTEAYVVLDGSGRLQTLGPDGFGEVPLRPGDLVWFTPGVIHRPINDGGLDVLVVMANGGLPEAGDCVLTFPPEVLADPDLYAAANAAVPSDPGGAQRVDARDAAAARTRRDLAIEGFLALRAQVEAAGASALDPFYAAARRLVAPKLDDWERRWADGALAAAESTRAQLAALRRGDTAVLHDGGVFVGGAAREERFGMCGRLSPYESGSSPPD